MQRTPPPVRDSGCIHRLRRLRSAGEIWALLRSRGITAVIAAPRGQVGNRKRKGSKGLRPPGFDADAYKGRNVIERSFKSSSSGAARPPGTTSSP